MDKRIKPDDASELRRSAEDLVGSSAAGAAPGWDPASQKLIHELQVHQVELELQNAELLAARAEVEAGLARYTELYDFAPVGYFTLDREGTILQLNLSGARLLGADRSSLVNRRLAQFIAADARASFSERLGAVFAGPDKVSWEAQLAPDAAPPRQVRFEAIAEEAGGTCLLAATDITAQRLAEQARAEAVQRSAELARRLLEIQEAERRHLAQSLHDVVSPNLAAIGLSLESILGSLPPAQREALGPRLEDTRALLADTAAGIRDICFDLRPASLDYWGLLPAVESYAAQLGQRTGIQVQVHSEEIEGRLPAEVEVLVFRIVQEALTNCVKHSGARAIDIALEKGKGRLRVTIGDDGVGFDPQALDQEKNGAGLGLLTMRERAEYAGGTFRIESQPGQGTRIVLEV